MKLTVPNLLSLLRMGLVPLFIIALVEGNSKKGLLIFVVAGVTDALDGFFARYLNQKSLLGAYLDPIADKLLLTSAYVVLSIPQLNHGTQIPLWVTILVISRDVLLVTAALLFYLAAGIRNFPPSLLSKITTVAQVAAVMLVLLSGSFPQTRLIDLAADSTIYLVAGLTLASGLHYVARANKLK
jgi:cardiolipin synthase